jgi:hypothetical protein
MKTKYPLLAVAVLRSAALLCISPTSLPADALDNWHVRNALPAENLLTGVAYGNGIYVAVGTGGILTSSDGAHSSTNFVDTMATNFSRRFYRVVSP